MGNYGIEWPDTDTSSSEDHDLWWKDFESDLLPNLEPPQHYVVPSLDSLSILERPQPQARKQVVCFCRIDAVTKISEQRGFAGRRYFTCANVSNCCGFSEWIDPPLCQRGSEYALEMQIEKRRLEAIIRRLEILIRNLQSP